MLFFLLLNPHADMKTVKSFLGVPAGYATDSAEVGWSTLFSHEYHF